MITEWHDKDSIKDSNACDNNSPNQNTLKSLKIYR